MPKVNTWHISRYTCSYFLLTATYYPSHNRLMMPHDQSVTRISFYIIWQIAPTVWYGIKLYVHELTVMLFRKVKLYISKAYIPYIRIHILIQRITYYIVKVGTKKVIDFLSLLLRIKERSLLFTFSFFFF
jgi:hypothetical protein